MAASKSTAPKAASSASKMLLSRSIGASSKTASESALFQVKTPVKIASTKAATSASRVFRDRRSSSQSKTAAASSLVQKFRSK